MLIHILLWLKPSPKPLTGHNSETKVKQIQPQENPLWEMVKAKKGFFYSSLIQSNELRLSLVKKLE